MKKRLLIITILLAFLFIPLIGLRAAQNNQLLLVGQNETIAGNLYHVAENVTIDGTISGDLMVVANTLVVNGRIEGDIIAIAQNITINGEVVGNVRVAGNYIAIDGLIGRNLNAFGAEILIEKNAKVGWDAVIGASTAIINGEIKGSLNGYLQKLFLSGKIGKNVDLKIHQKEGGQDLVIAKAAEIGGNFTYSTNKTINLDNINIAGKVIYQPMKEVTSNKTNNFLGGVLFSFLSITLIGLLFIFKLKKLTDSLLLTLKNNFFPVLLKGTIFVLIIPLISLILLLTIIGIPAAIILMSLWLAGILLAKSLTAIFFGNFIVTYLFKDKKIAAIWSLMLGALVLSLLFFTPWIGWLIKLLSIWLGLGGIYFYVTNKSKNL